MKLRLIKLIDWFDANILQHCFYPWLCGWLAEHPWWGPNEELVDIDYAEEVDDDANS